MSHICGPACFLGKDARLYVYKLSVLKRGIEERQLVRTKCDSRENKLEKTKGMRAIICTNEYLISNNIDYISLLIRRF